MRVTLRGEPSIDLNNNGALFVIDGVPMFTLRRPEPRRGAYAIDYGNGTGDANPEDIENITVLKGPAATASTVRRPPTAPHHHDEIRRGQDGSTGDLHVEFRGRSDQLLARFPVCLRPGSGPAKGNDGFHYGDPMARAAIRPTCRRRGPQMDGTPISITTRAAARLASMKRRAHQDAVPVSRGNWLSKFFQTDGWRPTRCRKPARSTRTMRSVFR